MARTAGAKTATLYDFFVETPGRQRQADEIEFNSVHADFGRATQEFHIGHGATAVPGYVPGLFAVNDDLGSLPMSRLLEPAMNAALDGIEMTGFQAFLSQVVTPILTASADSRALFAPDGHLFRKGETFQNPQLGAFFKRLGAEGMGFYEEQAVPAFAQAQAPSGQLQASDFLRYEVVRREALKIDFAGQHVYLNPPPSTGGAFVAHGLANMQHEGGTGPLELAAALRQAENMRSTHKGNATAMIEALGLPAINVEAGGTASRGTTHISVIDADGNAASATVSNGEGNGHIAAGYGFMLNNMLGEEDLNPGGFHRWRPSARLASNMCPVIACGHDGDLTALGSGGSNRIRSAIFQVLVHTLSGGRDLADAVALPRLHIEGEQLDFENLFGNDAGAALQETYPVNRAWDESNLFFGGVHAVSRTETGFEAAGDRRRGGYFAIVS